MSKLWYLKDTYELDTEEKISPVTGSKVEAIECPRCSSVIRDDPDYFVGISEVRA